jgi:hypothetical protein
MTARLNAAALLPDLYKAYYAFSQAGRRTGWMKSCTT